MEIKKDIKSYLFYFILESAVVRSEMEVFYDAKTMFKWTLFVISQCFVVKARRETIITAGA